MIKKDYFSKELIKTRILLNIKSVKIVLFNKPYKKKIINNLINYFMYFLLIKKFNILFSFMDFNVLNNFINLKNYYFNNNINFVYKYYKNNAIYFFLNLKKKRNLFLVNFKKRKIIKKPKLNKFLKKKSILLKIIKKKWFFLNHKNLKKFKRFDFFFSKFNSNYKNLFFKKFILKKKKKIKFKVYLLKKNYKLNLIFFKKPPKPNKKNIYYNLNRFNKIKIKKRIKWFIFKSYRKIIIKFIKKKRFFLRKKKFYYFKKNSYLYKLRFKLLTPLIKILLKKWKKKLKVYDKWLFFNKTLALIKNKNNYVFNLLNTSKLLKKYKKNKLFFIKFINKNFIFSNNKMLYKYNNIKSLNNNLNVQISNNLSNYLKVNLKNYIFNIFIVFNDNLKKKYLYNLIEILKYFNKLINLIYFNLLFCNFKKI